VAAISPALNVASGVRKSNLLRDAVDACRRAGSAMGGMPVREACVRVAGLDYWAQMFRTFSCAVISGVVSMVIEPSLSSRAGQS
jgi:hypothetical protein